MKKNQTEINRADALIITVGTRQVGWRCEDGAVRCLGADADRGHPPHVNQLYEILGVEREYHDKSQSNSLWSVRDLGERFHKYCEQELNGDFSNVELLLDQTIIANLIPLGLKHIILWATDQPETVPWAYRRADTIWLAKLMEGKIKNTWNDVEVDVLHPVVHANNAEAIREELEGFILPWTISQLSKLSVENEPPVLAIQNKGSIPAIAEGLTVCVAALVRQCQVFIYQPKEPSPLYETISEEVKSGNIAVEYNQISLSQYFWPLERLRIIDAWKKGNFSEAQIWLTSHQTRYRFLHQLAGYLAISSNWEISSFLENKNLENSWFRSKDVSQNAGSEQVEKWRYRLQEVRKDDYAKVWESTFFIYILLLGENYTGAFFQFAQTLERLLYEKYQKDRFVKDIADQLVSQRQRNYPTFEILIDALFYSPTPKKKEKEHELFHGVRNKRNDLVHKGNPISLKELAELWSNTNLEIDISTPESILNAMQKAMERVTGKSSSVWNETMLFSLYQWGLNILESEEASNQI